MLGSSARESQSLESSSNINTFTNHLKYNLYSFLSKFLSIFILLIKILNVSTDIIKINVDTDM
jgi:hypothetical protein